VSDKGPTGTKRGRKPMDPEEKKKHKSAYNRKYREKHRQELRARGKAYYHEKHPEARFYNK